MSSHINAGRGGGRLGNVVGNLVTIGCPSSKKQVNIVIMKVANRTKFRLEFKSSQLVTDKVFRLVKIKPNRMDLKLRTKNVQAECHHAAINI